MEPWLKMKYVKHIKHNIQLHKDEDGTLYTVKLDRFGFPIAEEVEIWEEEDEEGVMGKIQGYQPEGKPLTNPPGQGKMTDRILKEGKTSRATLWTQVFTMKYEDLLSNKARVWHSEPPEAIAIRAADHVAEEYEKRYGEKS